MKEEKKYIKTEITMLQNEISGDYILPDSYPDVKNILSSSARIYDLKKYFGANEGEISGSIAYNIMFSAAGDNGEDVICSVGFNDDFKFNCRYKCADNVGVGTHTRLDELNCRMANPRKFSIKALLETLLYEDVSESPYPLLSADAPLDADMQYKWDKCEVCRCRSALLCEHSFSDNIELDMKLPEISEILHCDTALNVKDDRAGDIKEAPVKLGGILTLSIIYKDKDELIHGVSRDIPFGITVNEDESAMIGDIDAGNTIIPAVYISAVNVNIGKNGYDEAKVIEFDADYDIDLLIVSSEVVEYVTDAYSTRYDCECKYETKAMTAPITRIKNNFTYTDSRDKSELGLENTMILSACVPTLVDIKTEKNGNFVNISGKISENTTILHDENRVKSKAITLPFTYKSNANLKQDNIAMIGNAVVADNRVRADSEHIYTDAEIYLDYMLTVKETANICKSVSVSTVPCKQSDSEVFCIYYPMAEETLWETAKNKKTTLEKIMMLNPGVEDGAPLIIE